MTERRLALGRRGEARARRFLRRRGLRVIARNWKHPLGELDLVARDGDAVVFVEVRTASRVFAGGPAHTVGPDKRRRLARLAQAWLQSSPWSPAGVRFDVVALVYHGWRGWFRWTITHYPNAFEVDSR